MGRPAKPKVTRPCEKCGQEVSRPPHQMRSAHTFCSQSCYLGSTYRADLARERNFAQNPDARVSLPCEQCGTTVERYVSTQGKQTFCSRECHDEYRRSQHGRRRTGGGYVLVFVGRDYPGAMKSGHVMEHRKVMQDMLGRPLVKEENVHHINGVRDDNRPENLELWSHSQPKGQRVEDKIRWAREFLALYEQGEPQVSRFVQDGTGIVVSVADEKDHRFGAGWTVEGAEPATKSDTPDKTWKVAELTEFATANGIDLGAATKKDDILAVLTAPSA